MVQAYSTKLHAKTLEEASSLLVLRHLQHIECHASSATNRLAPNPYLPQLGTYSS